MNRSMLIDKVANIVFLGAPSKRPNIFEMLSGTVLRDNECYFDDNSILRNNLLR